MENKMFCYQCQETAGCAGCTQMGVCGKKPEVAAMQDLLVYVTKGLSAITTQLRAEGKEVPADVNHLITLNLFITITNANFGEEMADFLNVARPSLSRELMRMQEEGLVKVTKRGIFVPDSLALQKIL